MMEGYDRIFRLIDGLFRKPFTPRQYKLGGGLGRHVSLMKPDQDINPNEPVKVWGHFTPRPRKGDRLAIEGRRSWMEAEFTTVELCADPADMFFADVRVVHQKMREPKR
jgi:hypothetical protein